MKMMHEREFTKPRDRGRAGSRFAARRAGRATSILRESVGVIPALIVAMTWAAGCSANQEHRVSVARSAPSAAIPLLPRRQNYARAAPGRTRSTCSPTRLNFRGDPAEAERQLRKLRQMGRALSFGRAQPGRRKRMDRRRLQPAQRGGPNLLGRKPHAGAGGRTARARDGHVRARLRARLRRGSTEVHRRVLPEHQLGRGERTPRGRREDGRLVSALTRPYVARLAFRPSWSSRSPER
jgi:hypothetical protein